MKTKPYAYNRARMLIMHDVLSFYITSDWEPNQEYGRKTPAINGFTPTGYGSTRDPEPGDLAILKSAPATKWTIGWVREIAADPIGGKRYLMESLEDGSLCWWSNVGMDVMPKKNIRARYRWSDKQFEFSARWMRQRKHAGPVRFQECQFDPEGHAVTLSITGYWDFSLPEGERVIITRHFDDYRKVTVAMMRAAVAEMETELDNIKWAKDITKDAAA